MSDQMPDEVWVCRDVTGVLYLRTGRPSPLEPDDTRYIKRTLYDSKPCPHVVGETTQHCTLAQEEVQRLTQRAEQAEADRDTLGYHLERTQSRARELESKVTAKVADLSALARWAVDLEAERDRLRAALADIEADPWDYQRVQDKAQEALDHD